jgi:hypothetical protein
VDEHVGVRDEAVEHVARGRLLEVEHDARLVAVDADEDAALVLDARRNWRTGSPCGGSILTTSAPRSASSVQP